MVGNRTLVPAPDLRFAKAGGPPDDWHTVTVVDNETGQEIRDVVCVNLDARMVEKFAHDENGKPKPDATGEEYMIERIFGDFQIMRVVDA